MDNAEQFELTLRLLLAFALGASIGFEREFRGHEAGIRTMGLVCLGAAIFGEVSIVTGESRISAGVVQGIGFIGAGIIFQRGNWIVGLTTAATAWVMAGIGLAIAYDLVLAAVLVTVAIVIILELEKVTDWLLSQSATVREERRRREEEAAERRASERDTR